MIPVTARNGLLEDTPTDKVEPEKELEEDRYNEEKDKPALKAIQGVFSINKSDSISAERHITNFQHV